MSNGRRVLVTGASTGIGRASVDALVAAGFSVFATVRRDEDAEALRKAYGATVTPLMMDLLDDDSVRAMGAEVVAAGSLFGVINNAGAAFPGPLEYLPIELFRRQQVNGNLEPGHCPFLILLRNRRDGKSRNYRLHHPFAGLRWRQLGRAGAGPLGGRLSRAATRHARPWRQRPGRRRLYDATTCG